MKISAIRIKNLASLEGLTEIDFTQEPLRSSGIFAITGPTGSGKSTILDALCLALYAKTPRYLQAESRVTLHDVLGNTISQDDVRGILRDGTAEGYAEVDFVGIDGQPYRAQWHVRRARNKVDGSLQADKPTLTNLRTGAIFGDRKNETLNEIERVVGLSFEQFTRSVLLAQGDFTAFLRASKDEKASLLEKLTGTEIYSHISKRIFERYRDEEQKVQTIKTQMGGIQTLTSEERDELESKQTELNSAILDLKERQQSILEEINWYQREREYKTALEDAISKHRLALSAQHESATDRRQLKEVEAVRDIQGWHDSLANAKRRKTANEIQLQDIDMEIRQTTALKERHENELKTAEEELKKQVENQREAAPILDQAKRLNTQIESETIKLQELEQDLKQQQGTLDEHTRSLAQSVREEEVLNDRIKSLQEWLKENESRKSIVENHALITSKLNDTRVLLDDQLRYAEQIQKVEHALLVNQQQREKLSIQQNSINRKLDKLQSEHDKRQQALENVSISTVEATKEKLESEYTALLNAGETWRTLYRLKKEQKTADARLAAANIELTVKKEQREHSSQQLKSAYSSQETALRILEKSKLAAERIVPELRRQLANDEPCMVCGSTTHPYRDHPVPKADDILAAVQEEYDRCKHDYDRLQKQGIELDAEISALGKNIRAWENEQDRRSAELKTSLQKWEYLPVKSWFDGVKDEERDNRIAEATKKNQVLLATAKQDLKDYQNQKGHLEELKKSMDTFKNDLSTLKDKGKDLDTALEIATRELKQLKQDHQDAEYRLLMVRNELSHYFPQPEWLENWKANPELFTSKISGFVETWKTKSSDLESGTLKKSLLEAEIQRGTNTKSEFEKGLTLSKEKIGNQQKGMLELVEARKKIFEGKPVSEVEKDLQHQLDTASETKDVRKDMLTAANLALTSLQARQESLSTELEKLDKEIEDSTKKIDNWISNYNKNQSGTLDFEQLATLLGFSNDWLAEKRAYLRRIDDEVTTSNSILSERERTYNNHVSQQKSETPLAELQTKESSIRDEIDESNKLLGYTSQQLRQDDKNRLDTAGLQSTLERQLEVFGNWAKLNEVIGSADGKKFKLIAQGYTLDVLLSYANVHLQVLSKRYRIQRIPDSLGLQVVDKDMGDEIRTVYSLSGGESFLVSLALALGLASLSSSKVNVESLFIDEGFGSLDPDTLNIAMDALERLHNQGRKVGVISHVQDMTERIPVQIQVSKQTNGKSQVTVL